MCSYVFVCVKFLCSLQIRFVFYYTQPGLHGSPEWSKQTWVQERENCMLFLFVLFSRFHVKVFGLEFATSYIRSLCCYRKLHFQGGSASHCGLQNCTFLPNNYKQKLLHYTVANECLPHSIKLHE